jgi:hypothetical protein
MWQADALAEALKKLGYEVVVVDDYAVKASFVHPRSSASCAA